jgi:hypothetical protein
MSIRDTRQIAPTANQSDAWNWTPSPLFPEELIACIADGREPTTAESKSMARRISAEAGLIPVVGWVQQAAHLALAGDGKLANNAAEVSRLCGNRVHKLRRNITSSRTLR